MKRRLSDIAKAIFVSTLILSFFLWVHLDGTNRPKKKPAKQSETESAGRRQPSSMSLVLPGVLPFAMG